MKHILYQRRATHTKPDLRIDWERLYTLMDWTPTLLLCSVKGGNVITSFTQQVHLDKLQVAQLVKKLTMFYRTLSFIMVFRTPSINLVLSQINPSLTHKQPMR